MTRRDYVVGAAVWLMALDAAAANHAAKTEFDAMVKAAGARRYDDHFRKAPADFKPAIIDPSRH